MIRATQYHRWCHRLALNVTLFVLGVGVGCLGDDLRSPYRSSEICVPLAAGCAFWMVTFPVLLCRRGKLAFPDVVAPTAGGGIAIIVAAALMWPARSVMLAIAAALGALLASTGQGALKRRAASLALPRVLDRVVAAVAFLLLSTTSGLGGGFLIMYIRQHGDAETASVAGNAGAAVGAVIVLAAGVVLWKMPLPRPIELASAMRIGACSIVFGCAAASVSAALAIVASGFTAAVYGLVERFRPARRR